MIKVGVTGGIGSGKSTVCAIFERLGVPVYYADLRAKQLMEDNASLVSSIKELIGEPAYDQDDKLDRPYIANIVFGDEEKLIALNGLVHPAVRADYLSWVEVLTKKNYPYCIKEAALLVETGSYKELDKLIVVTAPYEDRIQRVMARDQTTHAQVEKRIAAQMLEEEKVALADFVIANDKIMDLMPIVSAIHLKLTTSN